MEKVTKGKLEVIRKVLHCRASQIDNPGPRDCRGCPYLSDVGDCEDLEIMRDALETIEYLDMFRTMFTDALDKGYTIRFNKEVAKVEEE